MLTPETIMTSMTTLQATTTTAVNNTTESNAKDDYWLKYTFIVGIAAAVLVVCIVIAIVISRFKSIRKAKAQYRRDQMRARQEIEEQKRASRTRTMSTIISSSDPFFVYHPDVRVNPLTDDVFMSDDDVAYSASKRNSYIQAIPSFSHATDLTDAVKAMRDVNETPPPRLSPSFQDSEERRQDYRVPPRRHSVSAYPYPQPQGRGNRYTDCPPAVLPREPIPPTRRPWRRPMRCSGSLKSKMPVSRGRSQSAFEIQDNCFGFITEELEPIEIMAIPDYD